MIAIAVLIVRMLCDCFKSPGRLATEILILRHQLNVLQQHTPGRLHLRWADRASFIWLYRRCPRILDAITIVRSFLRNHMEGIASIDLFVVPTNCLSTTLCVSCPWPSTAAVAVVCGDPNPNGRVACAANHRG